MNKIKVLTVFGTRPEAIKMAPLVIELKKYPEIESYCAVTAQHREMLDSVLKIFNITPDFDLNIMKERQTLSSIVSRSIVGLDEVFSELKPDIVLVHGDTSTTFSGALTAFFHGIKVGHVEAGLRSFDKYSPFPEEMNRKLTGNIADLHFCPTLKNRKNLENEKLSGEFYITGNTVIDALKTTIKDDYQFKNEFLANYTFPKRTILLTAHRRENYGEPFENIFKAVNKITATFEDVEVIYPVHLSPVVRDMANSFLGENPRVHLIEPIDVDDMHNLMSRCYLVLTDSGGLQEEAPSLGKPVLVLRAETERPEAVEAGTVKMAGIQEKVIYDLAAKLLSDSQEYEKMAKAANPYGDGEASRRIVQNILFSFGLYQNEADEFKGE